MRAVHVFLLNVVFVTLLYIAVQHGFGTTTIPVSSPQPQVAAATTQTASTSVQDPLLNEINAQRVQRQLNSLIIRADLEAVAKSRNNDMIFNQYYDHVSPYSGATFTDFLDYSPAKSCENLQLDFDSSPRKTVQAWLESKEGHKECLLHPSMRYIGLAEADYMTVSTDDGPKKSKIFTAVFVSN